MANGGNPNTNPKCGSQISIYSPTSGQTVQATVVDTCVGCGMYDVDVSESVFATLAGGLSAGRVPVDWGENLLLVVWMFLCGKLTTGQCFKGRRPSSESEGHCVGAAGIARSGVVSRG